MNSCPRSRNVARTRWRDFGCGISRIDDPIAKMYWSKWWICWVIFKLKCSIPFSQRQILRCYVSMETLAVAWNFHQNHQMAKKK
jgi:hypothetical protein